MFYKSVAKLQSKIKNYYIIFYFPKIIKILLFPILLKLCNFIYIISLSKRIYIYIYKGVKGRKIVRFQSFKPLKKTATFGLNTATFDNF